MGKKADALRQQLATAERKAGEYLAGQVHQYHAADHYLGSASIDKMMASGVILQLTALGGREIVQPVLIRDGLSNETIEAIRNDLRRSYLLAVSPKPQGL